MAGLGAEVVDLPPVLRRRRGVVGVEPHPTDRASTIATATRSPSSRTGSCRHQLRSPTRIRPYRRDSWHRQGDAVRPRSVERMLAACALAALDPEAASDVGSCDERSLRPFVWRRSPRPAAPPVPGMRIDEDPAVHARRSRRPREHEVHELRASVQEPERLNRITDRRPTGPALPSERRVPLGLRRSAVRPGTTSPSGPCPSPRSCPVVGRRTRPSAARTSRR